MTSGISVYYRKQNSLPDLKNIRRESEFKKIYDTLCSSFANCGALGQKRASELASAYQLEKSIFAQQSFCNKIASFLFGKSTFSAFRKHMVTNLNMRADVLYLYLDIQLKGSRVALKNFKINAS